MAERQGFEPWKAFALPVFKTGAFNRSAISPDVFLSARGVYIRNAFCQKIFREILIFLKRNALKFLSFDLLDEILIYHS